MASSELSIFISRSGQPSVRLNGSPYHSPYDPVREAQKFCSDFKVEEADIVLLFGWGLGYCGSALLPRLKPNARVIVFEPDKALFELGRNQPWYHQVSMDTRFEFVVADQIPRFFDRWALEACQDDDRFIWVEWPAAASSHGDVLHALKSSFRTRLRDKAANLLTHFQRGGMYFENALSNFRFQNSADVGRLFGRFPQIPMVIVSAGPSLDLNVHELRGVENRCFVLAVDTALRPLLAAGVTPHAVVVADPSEANAKHVAGAVPESVYMIAEQAVQPAALEAARFRFLFGLGLFPDPLFEKFGFGKSTLNVWGSVATAALDLACRIGANPIIFTGQDFAYSWNREYASHTIYHAYTKDTQPSGPIKQPDIFGNPVETTENLVAYRDFFVRKIRQWPRIKFINATQGGILREMVEIVPLREALSQFCKKPVDIGGLLSECYRTQKTPPVALEHFLQVLKSRSRSCTCLDGFLELTAKQALLEKESAKIDEKIHWGIERTQMVLDQFGK